MASSVLGEVGRSLRGGAVGHRVTKAVIGRARSCSCTHRLSGFSLCLSFWLHWSSWMVCPEPFCWDESLSTS